MIVTEELLLRSGFNGADLKKIKNNLESYGGTLGEAVQDLANRFRIVLWIFYACLAVFVVVFFSSEKLYVLSTGTGLLITMLIVLFIQPPVLSYKSWRYWKNQRN